MPDAGLALEAFRPPRAAAPSEEIAPAAGELVATTIALKEWAVVCYQLVTGQQSLLIRKGGIHEQKKGFAIEHDAFFLYPNVEHQSREQLKPQAHALLDVYGLAPQETGTVVVPGYCRVTDVLRVDDPARLRALQPLTCWTQALFDVRLAYKPDRPNFVVIVRAYRLPQPVHVPYVAAYGGCRSWVPLRQVISPDGAIPVLDDASFQAHRQNILDILN